MILEFYCEQGSHPSVYDIYLDKEGQPTQRLPKPEGIEGVRQFVLEGTEPSSEQLLSIRDVMQRRPRWKAFYFFEQFSF